MERICESCKHWQAIDDTMGSCRALPPRIVPEFTEENHRFESPCEWLKAATCFPVTWRNDSCGEFYEPAEREKGE